MLAVILVAVTGLAILSLFYKPSSRPIAIRHPEVTESQTPSREVSIVKEEGQPVGQAKAGATADSWRDPFNIPGKSDRPAPVKTAADLSPVTAPVVVPERLPQLKGIISGALELQAFIDDDTVAVGDSVAGYQVQSIDASSVTLAKEGKVIVLRLE